MKAQVTARLIKKVNIHIQCAECRMDLKGYAAVERTSKRGKVEYFAIGSWTGSGLKYMLDNGLIAKTSS